MKLTGWLTIILLVSGMYAGAALAKDEVGSVVAVRGKAVIEREKKTSDAKVTNNILLNDIFSTLEASKAKLLFVDDSVLTLGEKSKVVIKEFIYSKDKGGRSILNLIDGKLKTVVGKANLEVHTPTVVASARGTIILFLVGIKDGRKFTTIICLENVVELVSSDSSIKGAIKLTAGMMITIFEGDLFDASPTMATGADIENLLKHVDIGSHEISVPGPMHLDVGVDWFTINAPLFPPVDQQQPNAGTDVNINVIFPK